MGRPRLDEQAAYDARSLSLLHEYEVNSLPVAALAERSGCATSTMWRRLQRARELRANKDKTTEAMHERIERLEEDNKRLRAALIEMGARV